MCEGNSAADEFGVRDRDRCTPVVLFWASSATGDERIDRAAEFTATGTIAALRTALGVVTRLPGGGGYRYSALLLVQRNMYRLGMETLVHQEALARFGYALSDGTRTQILLKLRSEPGYPSDLAEQIGVSRQILSNHLACLRGCGLVVAVPEGRRVRYELADQRIGRALDDLIGLVLAVDPACCAQAPDQGCG